jgi:hypothetical protein
MNYEMGEKTEQRKLKKQTEENRNRQKCTGVSHKSSEQIVTKATFMRFYAYEL